MGLQHRPANGRGSGKKEAKAATPSKSDMLIVLSQTPTHKLDPTNPAHFVVLVERYTHILQTTLMSFKVCTWGKYEHFEKYF